VRLAYAADLPTPDEVIRSLDGNDASPAPRAAGNGGTASSTMAGPTASRFEGSRGESPRGAPRAALASVQPMGDPVAAPVEATAPVLAVATFEGLIALAVQKRDLSVKAALERDMRLVRCEDGRLDVALEPSAAKTLVNDLSTKFSQWTGRRWVVVVSREAAQPTVKSQLDAKQAELKTGVQADPLVQAVLSRFPGAQIVDVRAPDQVAALPGADPDDELPLEPPPADEDSYGADWMRDEDRED
jgi:DNA polymerase III subunit gamma/tau